MINTDTLRGRTAQMLCDAYFDAFEKSQKGSAGWEAVADVVLADTKRLDAALQDLRVMRRATTDDAVASLKPMANTPVVGDPRWIALVDAFCSVMQEFNQDVGVLQASESPVRRLRLPLATNTWWAWEPSNDNLDETPQIVAREAYMYYRNALMGGMR